MRHAIENHREAGFAGSGSGPVHAIGSAVVVEVPSASTRRVDMGEKLEADMTIPSLAACLLVEQDSPTVSVHRRTEGSSQRDIHEGREAAVPLTEIGIELPLSDVYDGVPGPEPAPASG
jgi:Uma2 family endonuclease